MVDSKAVAEVVAGIGHNSFLRDALPADPIELAGYLKNFFKSINRGHRKNVHRFIAGAALNKRKFLDEPQSYRVYCTRELQTNGNELPEKLTSSRPLLISMMGATTRSEQTQAGKYARAADYLIDKGIVTSNTEDGERYLNEHGYENILKKAAQEFPSKKNTRGKPRSASLHLRVLNSTVQRIRRVQEYATVPVSFLIECTMVPGEKGIHGILSFGIKPSKPKTITADQFCRRSVRRRRAWFVETELAGGTTPYVLSSDGHFVLGLRGDPLIDESSLPVFPQPAKRGKAVASRTRTRSEKGK